MTSRRNGQGVAVTRTRSVEFTPPAPTALVVRPTTDAADFFREQAVRWEQLPPLSDVSDAMEIDGGRLNAADLCATQEVIDLYVSEALSCGDKLLDLPSDILPGSVSRRLEADPQPDMFVTLAVDRARLSLPNNPAYGGKHITGPQLRHACALLCRQIAGWIDTATGGSREQADSKPKRNGSDPQLEWLFDQTQQDMRAAGESAHNIELRLQELRSSSSPEMLHDQLEKLNALHKRWEKPNGVESLRKSHTYRVELRPDRERASKPPASSAAPSSGAVEGLAESSTPHQSVRLGMRAELDGGQASPEEKSQASAEDLLDRLGGQYADACSGGKPEDFRRLEAVILTCLESSKRASLRGDLQCLLHDVRRTAAELSGGITSKYRE